jgi:hypothetical protein
MISSKPAMEGQRLELSFKYSLVIQTGIVYKSSFAVANSFSTQNSSTTPLRSCIPDSNIEEHNPKDSNTNAKPCHPGSKLIAYDDSRREMS